MKRSFLFLQKRNAFIVPFFLMMLFEQVLLQAATRRVVLNSARLSGLSKIVTPKMRQAVRSASSMPTATAPDKSYKVAGALIGMGVVTAGIGLSGGQSDDLNNEHESHQIINPSLEEYEALKAQLNDAQTVEELENAHSQMQEFLDHRLFKEYNSVLKHEDPSSFVTQAKELYDQMVILKDEMVAKNIYNSSFQRQFSKYQKMYDEQDYKSFYLLAFDLYCNMDSYNFYIDRQKDLLRSALLRDLAVHDRESTLGAADQTSVTHLLDNSVPPTFQKHLRYEHTPSGLYWGLRPPRVESLSVAARVASALAHAAPVPLAFLAHDSINTYMSNMIQAHLIPSNYYT